MYTQTHWPTKQIPGRFYTGEPDACSSDISEYNQEEADEDEQVQSALDAAADLADRSPFIGGTPVAAARGSQV